jgi:hypothetical protein
LDRHGEGGDDAAAEAMVLLNCAAENPYDRDKCLSLLDALRECIAQKVIPLRYLAFGGNAAWIY